MSPTTVGGAEMRWYSVEVRSRGREAYSILAKSEEDAAQRWMHDGMLTAREPFDMEVANVEQDYDGGQIDDLIATHNAIAEYIADRNMLARHLLDSGMTSRRLAEVVGVTHQTVRNWAEAAR